MMTSVSLRHGRFATFLLLTLPFAEIAAQDCGTGGGGNQTKFHSSSGPTTVTTPALTSADYAATESQLSGTLLLHGCCPNAGNGNFCVATIAAGAAGSPNLADASWRITSVSGRCAPAVPAVPLNTDFPLGAAKEVFRMTDLDNNGPFCVVAVQFRGTNVSFTAHQPVQVYSRVASFQINKTN